MVSKKKYKYGDATGVRTDERTKMATSLLAAQLTLDTGDNISMNQAIWIAIEKSYPEITKKAKKFFEKKKKE
jgi:hypothetical protein